MRKFQSYTPFVNCLGVLALFAAPLTSVGSENPSTEAVRQELESELGRPLKKREARRLERTLEAEAALMAKFEALSPKERAQLETRWERGWAEAQGLQAHATRKGCDGSEREGERQDFFCTNAGFANGLGFEVYVCRNGSGGKFFLTQAKLGLSLEAHAGVFWGRGSLEDGFHLGGSAGAWLLGGMKVMRFDDNAGLGLGFGLGLDLSPSVFHVHRLPDHLRTEAFLNPRE